MPNDIANNMADTVNQLEEDRIMLTTQLTNLQLAYNNQMLELKEAKRLLKAAVEDFSEIKPYLSEPYSHLCDKWRYADEALKLIEDKSNGI